VLVIFSCSVDVTVVDQVVLDSVAARRRPIIIG